MKNFILLKVAKIVSQFYLSNYLVLSSKAITYNGPQNHAAIFTMCSLKGNTFQFLILVLFLHLIIPSRSCVLSRDSTAYICFVNLSSPILMIYSNHYNYFHLNRVSVASSIRRRLSSSFFSTLQWLCQIPSSDLPHYRSFRCINSFHLCFSNFPCYQQENCSIKAQYHLSGKESWAKDFVHSHVPKSCFYFCIYCLCFCYNWLNCFNLVSDDNFVSRYWLSEFCKFFWGIIIFLYMFIIRKDHYVVIIW